MVTKLNRWLAETKTMVWSAFGLDLTRVKVIMTLNKKVLYRLENLLKYGNQTS